MIKKILFVLLASLLLTNGLHITSANAQTDARTVSTKIADLLAQLPANTAAQLEKNMKEVSALEENGYIELILGLNNAGKASNLIEYTVTGFTAYASKIGQESVKKMALSAYSKALPAISDKKNKAFIISQFDLIGDDSSISIIEPYLQDPQLVDEATRALAQIGSNSAVNTLIKGLSSTNEQIQMSIIEALGHTSSATAIAAILPFATHSNKNLVKTSLFTLAQTGSSSAGAVLLNAALQAEFNYEPTNAVASLLVYAHKISSSNKIEAEKIAKTILEKAKNDHQAHQRIAALEILSNISTDHKLFLNALKDKNFAYRAAAIKIATPTLNESNSSSWIKELKKADPLTMVSILDMFVINDTKSALPEILKLVKHKDQDVQIAAIHAAVKIGQDAKLPDLLYIMNTGSSTDITNISNGILRMPGGGVAPTVAAYIPTAKPELQVALINILAARAANEQIDFIFDALENPNSEVKNAAFKALKNVANTSNSDQLFTLLNSTNTADELTAIQEAIIASNKGIKDIDAQATSLLSKMQSAPADKKPLFYKILASLGGDKSLKSVANAYANGNDLAKQTAIEAFSSWVDASASAELIKIARTTNNPSFLSQSLTGYLQLIRKSNYPAEQRLLLLRNAMDLAPTNELKQQILKDLVQAKAYNSILFAGKYLDDIVLQQAAANAVMNIAMAGKYNGDIVKGLINKTISVITGPDASYQQEGMRKYISEMDAGVGFVQAFNGKDLTGWKGLVADPVKRSKMTPAALTEAQAKADAAAKESWKVINGELHFQSHGDNLATVKKYGDIEMLVDWKIIDDKKGEGDAGIYLRGTPQVQIWDLARTNVGAQVGSGGLYNNQKNPSKPLVVADNPLDEWNTFRILMIGDRVTVYLNGQLVTDNVILENYWDRNLAIFAEEQIELQAHGSPVAYRDIYIREIPRVKPFELNEEESKEGFKVLFDGTNMHHWTGNTTDYIIEDGNMAIRPKPGKGSGGNLFTKEQFSDFNFRFEFQLTPRANNGLGIRAPLEGDAAYVGMELQILDNDAAIYKNLAEYQYHGSVYGAAPAKRGYLKPVGEWNYQEVIAQGSKIKVILNGTVILDTDIEPFKLNGTIDGQDHPGLKRDSGHIGFLGHGSPVQFRNIRIKDLSKEADKKTATKANTKKN